MITFLHTFEPSRVLASFGPVTIYWYGFLYVLAFCAGMGVVAFLLRRRGESFGPFLDLGIAAFLVGILGGRLWYVLLIEPRYFLSAPWEIVALWHGGLAIHGGIAAAAGLIWWWARRSGKSFLFISDTLVPALALGQAIGRWGNYFNQELYGRFTNLPWSIPIVISGEGPTRVIVYAHPTFLYESAALLVLCGVLVWVAMRAPLHGRVTLIYLFGYAVIRFFVEFLRIDPTPTFLLRFPQWVSLGMVIAVACIVVYDRRKKMTSI